ncbi:MAG: DNA repair protein RadA [Marinilabiliales bacterium]|nr:MAG: DNA repair protein RadA [Marinilabiliales bacterium]
MARQKSYYLCQNCGAKASKWIGKCPECNQWNTFVEEIVTSIAKQSAIKGKSEPRKISSIGEEGYSRYKTTIGEVNRVLGGGLVKGSVILIGGEPGIGKSTLTLQLALGINDHTVLYVTGEESEEQIKMRAERLGGVNDSCFVMNDSSCERIIETAKEFKPGLLIIDSIQTIRSETVESSAGTVTQVRESTYRIQEYAREYQVPVLIVGHINKEGNLAGPKVLEHIVDTVLVFENDATNTYRVIRSLKNRYGAAFEMAVFEMTGTGLIEILNPSDVLLSRFTDDRSGICISSFMGGNRSFLVEVQALVSSAVYGTPQRSATGFDTRRLNMILAVLEKKAGFRLAVKDVFLNIAGGMRVDDPAIDLAVSVAVLSSDLDLSVDINYCFAGEIGLSGEIRPVNRLDSRIREAERVGFSKFFTSSYGLEKLKQKDYKISMIGVKDIKDLMKQVFK